MIDIYLILAWSSLLYHENYMDQYVKTKQSDGFHYYKLNSAQIIRHQQMIFQYKYFKMHYWKFSPVFWSNMSYIYGESSHLESYTSTSTSKFPFVKVNMLLKFI